MNMTDIRIRPGTQADIDAIEELYNDINDYLSGRINYAGWQKGLYPLRIHAEAGVAEKTLYVAEAGARIVGSVIVNHTPEQNYDTADWLVKAGDNEAYNVHTLAVRPEALRCGVGRLLVEYACEKAKAENMKTVRLVVRDENLPAVRLYEKLGFVYIDTVDLGFGDYGLPWFRLYEKVIVKAEQ